MSIKFTADKKKEIEKLIVDKSITALEQGFIEDDGLGEVATFVLGKIDAIQNQQQLVEFLREISNKWHFFSDMLVIESGEIQMNNEQKVIKQVQDLTDNGNIEEAIQLAKQANAKVLQQA